MTSDTGMVYH